MAVSYMSVRIGTRDAEACAAWYARHLGIITSDPVRYADGKARFVKARFSGFDISFDERDYYQSYNRTTNEFVDFHFSVDAATFSGIRALGTRIESAWVSPDGRLESLILRDPEGNSVSVDYLNDAPAR